MSILSDLLIDDIQKSCEYLAHLPYDLRAHYGLTDAPLKPVLGTDVESMLLQGDALISGSYFGVNGRYGRHPDAGEFVKRCNQKLSDLLFFQPTKDNPVHFDHALVEASLKPGEPQEMIRIFHEFDARASEIAESMGLTFIMGRGHWHLSLWQNDINHIGTFGVHGDLALDITKGLLIAQQAMPAFFMQPRIADKDLQENIGLPRRAHASMSNTSSSVRFARPDKKIATLENRLADGGVEQAIAMTLSAAVMGIKTKGQGHPDILLHDAMTFKAREATISFDRGHRSRHASKAFETGLIDLMRADEKAVLKHDGTLEYSKIQDLAVREILQHAVLLGTDQSNSGMGDGTGEYSYLIVPENAPSKYAGFQVEIFVDINLQQQEKDRECSHFMRGKRGFLSMIEDTYYHGLAEELLGDDLAHALLVNAVDRYREYLSWPIASKRYTEEEKANLLHLIDNLELEIESQMAVQYEGAAPEVCFPKM